MEARVREIVRERAYNRCEYCQRQQEASPLIRLQKIKVVRNRQDVATYSFSVSNTPLRWRQNRRWAFFVLVRPRCGISCDHLPNVKKVSLLFYLHAISFLVRLCRISFDRDEKSED